MMRAIHLGAACTAVLLFSSPGQVEAGMVTFDINNEATWGPISGLGGAMLWNGTGGGHLFNGNYYTNGSIHFSGPTTVNSWEMTNRPWSTYSGGEWGMIDVEMFDSSSNSLWLQTIDLTTNDWDNPLLVVADVTNVKRMTFYAPGNAPHFNGFWPSVDNITYNEAITTAPEPTSMALLGLAAVGGIGVRLRQRRKGKEPQAAA